MADGRKSAPNKNFYTTAALRSHHYLLLTVTYDQRVHSSQPSPSPAHRRNHQRLPRNPTPHRRHPSPAQPRRIQRRRLRPAATGARRGESAAEHAVPAEREGEGDGGASQGAVETVGPARPGELWATGLDVIF